MIHYFTCSESTGNGLAKTAHVTASSQPEENTSL